MPPAGKPCAAAATGATPCYPDTLPWRPGNRQPAGRPASQSGRTKLACGLSAASGVELLATRGATRGNADGALRSIPSCSSMTQSFMVSRHLRDSKGCSRGWRSQMLHAAPGSYEQARQHWLNTDGGMTFCKAAGSALMARLAMLADMDIVRGTAPPLTA